MSRDAPREVTGLLVAWASGDRAALDRLIPLVSRELHGIAHRFMRRERAGHTLQTTALVNEAYTRLVDVSRVAWQDRAHFYAVCASIMRRILVDAARERRYQKRGGAVAVVPLDEGRVPSPSPGVEVEALDEALRRLATFDPQAARIVELRFFGGLSQEETAAVVGVSPRTIRRDWAAAKVWLRRELTR
jgi:RNA polymerase sigma factor (TIGR02999 family)